MNDAARAAVLIDCIADIMLHDTLSVQLAVLGGLFALRAAELEHAGGAPADDTIAALSAVLRRQAADWRPIMAAADHNWRPGHA